MLAARPNFLSTSENVLLKYLTFCRYLSTRERNNEINKLRIHGIKRKHISALNTNLVRNRPKIDIVGGAAVRQHCKWHNFTFTWTEKFLWVKECVDGQQKWPVLLIYLTIILCNKYITAFILRFYSRRYPSGLWRTSSPIRTHTNTRTVVGSAALRLCPNWHSQQ